jgi:hypothetical protein
VLLDLPLTADFVSSWRFYDSLAGKNNPDPAEVEAVAATTATARL